MLAKAIVLHTILAALLVAAYFSGFLPILWEADKFWSIPVIGTLILTALGCEFYQNFLADRLDMYGSRAMQNAMLLRVQKAREHSLWIADKLPVIGLAFTVSGLVWAANAGLDADQFKRALVDSLVGNLMGILGFAWVELVVKVCR